ncbi:Large polyvalent protein associated domain 30 [compost metagenome]
MSVQVVAVGTRVSCALPYCGQGVIVAIHGTQLPESLQTVGDGVGVRGGNGHFDVVFENGSISHRIPESIVRGIQWTIYDEQASAEEIAQLLQNSERKIAADALARQNAEAAFAIEVECLQAAPELGHLTQGDDVYSGKLAAANMRAALRKAFPKVKFSVRKSHYGSVSVSWTDRPTETAVDAIVKRHKGGYFDDMEDIYKHEKTPFVAVFGGAEDVWTRREYSANLIERAIGAVFERYSGNLADIERPAAAAFQGGELCYVDVPQLGERVTHQLSDAGLTTALEMERRQQSEPNRPDLS